MDGTASHEGFEHAARFDAELTERQREVLRLIAAGRTNGEIAEALDMSLAGAKWHVSEVLTKLSLPSRDAAAAYYRWREAPRRRVARMACVLAPAAWWKAGLGAAGAVAAGVVAFVAIGALQGDAPATGPATPGLPFAMEARVTRTSGTSATSATVRYWFGDPLHLRIESETPQVLRGDVDFGTPGTMVLVFDGARRWSGGTVAGAVYESREILDPDREHPWGVDGTYLGPLYAGSLDAYLASQESEDSRMLRLGRERVLGIDTEVVARSRAGSAPGEWFIREWIDPERMLVLKFEARLPDSDGLVVAATATRLAYGQTQHPDLFEWRADPGAVELTCKSFLPLSPMDLPTPFLPVPAAALPADWILSSASASSVSSGDCGTVELVYSDRPGGPALLQVHENAEAPGEVVPEDASPVENRGTAAWVRVRPDASTEFAWVTGEVGVSLRSPVLSLDELQALAAAMLGARR